MMGFEYLHKIAGLQQWENTKNPALDIENIKRKVAEIILVAILVD